MIEIVFKVLLTVVALYAGCGLLVTMPFLTRWCRSFDPSARDGSWGFRVLIVPGIIALWPVIVAKVLAVRGGGGAAGEAETPVAADALRRNHCIAFIVLVIIAPLLFAVAVVWRAPEIPRSEGVPPPALHTRGGTPLLLE